MIERRVLADAAWFKSSYSATQDACVEVAMVPGVVGVRDTKNRDGGTLVFTSTVWANFLTRLKAGH
ncbi:hypothetical protein GCM10011581_09780 [Saccharopolyspora subtropica]|uniref:DUF397 domain-containing protein n=1 Tax=Saccharopolyspora thermophila TaxID=89367 RepID=A0A917JLC1_9PSEU|nr:DUF397 domain-containing protein [Saccharopolyspora subtropica]GGI74860.1 hypothetical protein GCM10011581_09780 [Saccharopolyspora subtropica]